MTLCCVALTLFGRKKDSRCPPPLPSRLLKRKRKMEKWCSPVNRVPLGSSYLARVYPEGKCIVIYAAHRHSVTLTVYLDLCGAFALFLFVISCCVCAAGGTLLGRRRKKKLPSRHSLAAPGLVRRSSVVVSFHPFVLLHNLARSAGNSATLGHSFR